MSQTERQPLRDESPAGRARDRSRRTLGIVAGALVGVVLAVLVMWLTDRVRITGSDRSPWVIIFGIPIACVVVGAVVGALLSGMREITRVDAPVRDERFRASGRAATSAEGQLPGSPVAPRVAGRDEDAAPPPPG
jgi:uncharacterized integral membrane protein